MHAATLSAWPAMRVLVAEDHRRLAETVAAGLRAEGMAVDVVFDGQDALDRVTLARYDVIVLDRDLPGVHGDQVWRELAARCCLSPASRWPPWPPWRSRSAG